MISPQAWALIYLVQLIVPSLAVGAVAVHSPRLLNVARISRFLVGFTVTPFLLAMWALAIATALPGAPRFLFTAMPALVSLPFLIRYGRRALLRLVREWRRNRAACANRTPVYFSYLAAALFIIIVITKLIGNARGPILAYDAMDHVRLTLPFAEARSVSAIPTFSEPLDDVPRFHSHSFLYQAFLSQALMTTDSDSLGFPNDHAARAAIQVLTLYLLLAAMALALTSGRFGAGAFALILLLQPWRLDYNSYYSHRDTFRIIPLLLIAALLSGFSARRLHRRIRPSQLIPCAGLAGFAIAAHSLNVVILPLVILAWALWVALGKAPFRSIAYVVGVIGVGVFLASLHYGGNLLETGSPWGYGYNLAFKDTPIRDNYQLMRQIPTIEKKAYLFRIERILARDRFRLSGQGIVAALVSLALWARFRGDRQTDRTLFLGLLTLFGMIPVTGALDFGRVPGLSHAFYMNDRYIQYVYPFAAVSVTFVLLELHRRYMLRKERRGRFVAVLVLIVLGFVPASVSLKTYVLIWRLPVLAWRSLPAYPTHLFTLAGMIFLIFALHMHRKAVLRKGEKWPPYAYGALIVLCASCAGVLLLFQDSIFAIEPGYRLPVAALCAFIFILVFHQRFMKRHKESLPAYASPVLIALYFVMMIFFLRNVALFLAPGNGLRYLWAFLALTALYAHRRLWLGEKGDLPTYASVALACFLISTTVISWRSVTRWRVVSEKKIENHRIWKIREIAQTIPQEQRILHDKVGTPYYLNNKTIFAFASNASELIHAKDNDELRSILDALKIRYVLFELPVWKNTILFNYLNDPRNASLLASEEDPWWPRKNWEFYEILEEEDANLEMSLPPIP